MATLAAVFVGRPRVFGADGRRWVSSILKNRIDGPVAVRFENLCGDEQADRAVHGGPDKAICVYAAAHYSLWRSELGLDGCGPGWCGENFSIGGQIEADVCVGDVFAVGSAIVQVSQPRGPCWKLARRWNRQDVVKRVVLSGRTGWYLRVLQPGAVEAGQALTLVERPCPDWPIERVNAVSYAREPRWADRVALAACTQLAAAWREALTPGGR
jgi:MOSC domain-containing protein YiiM